MGAFATLHFSFDSLTFSQHAGDEGHEEGHEAPCNEGCRRGGTSDESHEGNEGDEGHEEGHEAPRNEGCRRGCTSHEGDEGDESYEGHEGHEEVSGWKCLSMLLCSGREQCVASSLGGVPRLARLYKH